MKSKLLQIFLENEGNYVSGESISDTLGCSRTAVWKHVEDLRKNGYEVEAAPRKGYRITHIPNLLSEPEIKAGLKTVTIGKEIIYKTSLTSTQELAHRIANEGAEEGTLIVADEQTGGKGRLGRSWYSPIGTGIWMSVIVRPEIPPQKAPQLTLLTAVAVLRGMKEATGTECEIKWPNDILYEGKKIVGILTEMQAEPDQVHSIIIGVGINVNQQQFPPELEQIATSLRQIQNKELKRSVVIQRVLEEFEQLYLEYIENGFSFIKKLWEVHSITIGKRITARTVSNTLEGMAKGITDDGVLLLEDDSGQVHHIYSADIKIK